MLFDDLSELKNPPAWLVQYENPHGGQRWAVVMDKAPPQLEAGYDGQILAIFALPDDVRFLNLPALKVMALNGTLKKMEAQHG